MDGWMDNGIGDMKGVGLGLGLVEIEIDMDLWVEMFLRIVFV